MRIPLRLLTTVVVATLTTTTLHCRMVAGFWAQSQAGSAFQDLDPELPPIERAVALHNLAITKQQLGKREEAVEHLQTAVLLFESVKDVDPEIALPISNLLAALYLEKGQTEEARWLTRKTSTIAKRGGKNRDRAQTWIVLAELERTLGNYGKAKKAAQEAIKLIEPSLPDYSTLFEAVQNQLARIAFETSHNGAAATHWKLTLDSLKARRPESDEDVLTLRVDIARTLVLEDRLQEAESELNNVNRIAKEHGRTLALARGLYVLGTLYVEQKQPERGEAVFLQSLTITDKDLGPLSADSALSLMELTKLYLKARKPIGAEQFSVRATQVLSSKEEIPVVWVELMQLHVDVLKKLNRKGESKELSELVSQLLALKRAGNQTIDVIELRGRK